MRTKYKKIEFEFKLPDGVNIEDIKKGIRRVVIKCLREEGLSDEELGEVKINIELVEENDECKGGGHSPEQGEEEKNK